MGAPFLGSTLGRAPIPILLVLLGILHEAILLNVPVPGRCRRQRPVKRKTPRRLATGFVSLARHPRDVSPDRAQASRRRPVAMR
jgi:hypothetical protein